MQVERELAAAYGLKDVFVVPSVPDGDLNETIAKAAAMYISGRLTDNCFINMGYGDTPSRVLNNLATMTERPISCVSLTGGVNYYLPNTRSNIFNIKLYLIPAPLLASTKEMVAAMRNEESVMEISRMVKLCEHDGGGYWRHAGRRHHSALEHPDKKRLSLFGDAGRRGRRAEPFSGQGRQPCGDGY